MVELTKDILEFGRSKSGGWNAKQLRLLGVSWPPKKGWKTKILNKKYPVSVIQEFFAYKSLCEPKRWISPARKFPIEQKVKNRLSRVERMSPAEKEEYLRQAELRRKKRKEKKERKRKRDEDFAKLVERKRLEKEEGITGASLRREG